MNNKKELNLIKDEWTVEAPNEVLKFLFEKMSDRSKKSVKAMLSRGQVLVNGKSTTQFNDPLKPGDRVEIEKSTSKHHADIRGIEVLHEDDDIIVISKEAGLLSIATDSEDRFTAYRLLSNYLQTINPKTRIFIVHRLDKDTSGVMVFAKNQMVQKKLQDNWSDNAKERTYVALVEGYVGKSGTVTSYLSEDQSFKVRSSKDPKKGKKAITHYAPLNHTRGYTLLRVNLETGRKNQVRVHMSDIGHPVVGDKKYGAKSRIIKRLGLHAHAIALKHPSTGKVMRFEAKVPESLTRMFGKR